MLHDQVKIEAAYWRNSQYWLAWVVTWYVCCCKCCAPYLHFLMYWNAKPSFSTLPSLPGSLSHFFLEGKKQKISFLGTMSEKKGKQNKGESFKAKGKVTWAFKGNQCFTLTRLISVSPGGSLSLTIPLSRSAGVFQTGNGLRKFTLLSGYSFIPRWQWMDYDVEWVLQSVATCPRKSIKFHVFSLATPRLTLLWRLRYWGRAHKYEEL